MQGRKRNENDKLLQGKITSALEKLPGKEKENFLKEEERIRRSELRNVKENL